MFVFVTDWVGHGVVFVTDWVGHGWCLSQIGRVMGGGCDRLYGIMLCFMKIICAKK